MSDTFLCQKITKEKFVKYKRFKHNLNSFDFSYFFYDTERKLLLSKWLEHYNCSNIIEQLQSFLDSLNPTIYKIEILHWQIAKPNTPKIKVFYYENNLMLELK